MTGPVGLADRRRDPHPQRRCTARGRARQRWLGPCRAREHGARRASSSPRSSRLASPASAFAEVRYRVKTWNELDSCLADARAALDLVDRPTLLVGFSMGGAVSIGVSTHPSVVAVLGLAPWIPERLSLEGLVGKRFDVLHGSWDRYLPGIPGVSAASSRRGFDRARALGIDGSYELIERGLHGAAVRRRSGALLRFRERRPGSMEWERGSRSFRVRVPSGPPTRARERLRRLPNPRQASTRAYGARADSSSAGARSRPVRASRVSGSSATRCRAAVGRARGAQMPGTRGGCCASPPRR